MPSLVKLSASALSLVALLAAQAPSTTSALPFGGTSSNSSEPTIMPDPNYDMLFTRATSLSDCLSAAQRASTKSNGHTFGISTPSSANFGALSSNYNPVYHVKPSYVVTPTSGKDVKAVMACLAAEGGRVKLTPKGGGHSYASYSLGGVDGSVVVDLRKLDTLTIDAKARTATVGAGVRLGTLAEKLNQKGFALPHGTCPMVGMGHALGGGFGFPTRAWGFLLDRIESMRVVLPSGSVVTASATSEPDLFWGLRGAGANNFGIVTAFTFRLEKAPSKVVNFNYFYKSNEDCARVLVALQKWTEDANPTTGMPREIGGELLVSGSSSGDNEGNACQLQGSHLGATVAQHKVAMQKFLSQVKPAKRRVEQFSWIDSLVDIMGPLTPLTDPAKDHEQFYAKSLVTPSSGAEFDVGSALELVEQLDAIAGLEGTGNSISFDFLGPLSYPASLTRGSSAVASSFNAHEATFISQFYSYGFPVSNEGGKQDRVYAAMDKLVETMKGGSPAARWKAYVNYVDPRLEEWASMYYRPEERGRLKALKKRYDPKTILDFPQGLAHA